MNKIIYAFTLLGLALSAQAQFEDKSWTISGSLSANRDFISIAPEFGKVIGPNKLAGIRGSFSFQDFNGFGDQTTYSIVGW